MFMIRGFLGGLAGAVLAGVFCGMIGFVLQYSEPTLIALATVAGMVSGLLGFGIFAMEPLLAGTRRHRARHPRGWSAAR